MKTITPLFIILLACLSCNSSKPPVPTPTEPSKLIELAETKLGSPYNVIKNETEAYAIVSKELRSRPNQAYPTLRFFIMDLKTDEVVYENTELGGEIVWETEYIVKVTSNSGIPNPDAGNGQTTYRYHVKNKKKFSGKFLKNRN